MSPSNPTVVLSQEPILGTTSQTFKDAMVVRKEVFVEEQGVAAENEFDDNDKRCYHIVAYDSDADASERLPIGTIRIVPGPHEHHPGEPIPVGQEHANYLRLGRWATSKAYRGHGVGRKLIDAAVEWAARKEFTGDDGSEWNRMCLVHAQTRAVGLWEKAGFVVDESMGEWDEEGIMHKGLWMRIPKV
ncbi:acyl-CoA N-acyltransferase [Tuber brumale]|nr:acyl-CoA N-acyltransferase [Tuber brumale]